MCDKEYYKKFAGLVTASVALTTLSKAGQLFAIAGYTETAKDIRVMEDELYELILEHQEKLFGGDEGGVQSNESS